MKIKHIAIAVAAAATIAIGAAGTASARHGGSLRLSLHSCAPGTFQAGYVRFQNVGNNDFNEGARNYVAIRLCSTRPYSRVRLTRRYCGRSQISATRFKNVANSDFNEGAPNFVRMSLCGRSRLRRHIAISAHYCPRGTRTISAIRFKNVGNRDFNEGARNFVTIRLCRGRRI
ncbi:MAG: hypothetical protein ACTSUD_11340 [Alphaproteobacteria bacterium]